jgi:hypothetical protein
MLHHSRLRLLATVSVFSAALCCYCCPVDRQGLCLVFRNLPCRQLPHHQDCSLYAQGCFSC